jgi:hypothetical protein
MLELRRPGLVRLCCEAGPLVRSMGKCTALCPLRLLCLWDVVSTQEPTHKIFYRFAIEAPIGGGLLSTVMSQFKMYQMTTLTFLLLSVLRAGCGDCNCLQAAAARRVASRLSLHGDQDVARLISYNVVVITRYIYWEAGRTNRGVVTSGEKHEEP